MFHHHHHQQQQQQQQQDLYNVYAQVYGGAAATNFLPPQYNATDQFLQQIQFYPPPNSLPPNQHLHPSSAQPLGTNSSHHQRPFEAPSGNFLINSLSDIALDGFEEQLARVSASDTYVGPPRPHKKKDAEEKEEVVEVEDPLRQVPYSTSALAFVPPGVMVVSEVWNAFAEGKISICNGANNGMEVEALQRCLHVHDLNQLGSTCIMRRRLQEFVRRLRESAVGAPFGRPTYGAFELFPPLKGTPAGSKACGDNPKEYPMTKLDKPIVLTPDTLFDYLLIIDLEATCEDRNLPQSNNFTQEIIEFPVLLYDTRQRKCVGVFHSFCRPVKLPKLTPFCQNLTGITQDQVDRSVEFRELFRQLEHWLLDQNHLREQRCAVVCDCSADMGKFMSKQCQLSEVPMPDWAKVWINLSMAFRQFYRIPSGQKTHLKCMLELLGLSFVGQPHSGLHDAMNIMRVVQIMLADGCQLLLNQQYDPDRAPHYSANIPHDAALAASSFPKMNITTRSHSRSHNPGFNALGLNGYGPAVPSAVSILPPRQQHQQQQASMNLEDRDDLLFLHSIPHSRVNGPTI